MAPGHRGAAAVHGDTATRGVPDGGASTGEEGRGTQKILVSSLLTGCSPRINGENPEHVRILAESDAILPPILVHSASMHVIDGMHRVSAARLRHEETIEVRFFDGSEDAAFIAGVKANRSHGLPLSLADREAAASRIIITNGRYSDRWIATVAGLATGTVAAIRRRVGPDDGQPTARIGQDGRVRPLTSAHGRRAAAKAIAEHPEASLREIARIAGISPETVRDVRKRQKGGMEPVVSPQRGDRLGDDRPAGPTPERCRRSGLRDAVRSRESLLTSLADDPSLRFSESGRALLGWLAERATGPEGWQAHAAAIPPHSAYVVADIARRCADEWKELADNLEHRLQAMT
jgi:DNA-binding CsgD family transcriptional regulator